MSPKGQYVRLITSIPLLVCLLDVYTEKRIQVTSVEWWRYLPRE